MEGHTQGCGGQVRTGHMVTCQEQYQETDPKERNCGPVRRLVSATLHVVFIENCFFVLQRLRGDQAEGLHQLGHRSERGRPDGEHRQKHEPRSPSLHHGQGQ